MTEVVTIPRKEYEFLQSCVRILYEGSREQFRPEFIRRVRNAQRQLAEGKGVALNTRKQLRDHLESL